MAGDFLTKNQKEIGLFLGVFVAYLLTARLGLSIHPVNTFATLIWPPTGIALASLVLYGYGIWPALALAAFVVNISIGAEPLAALGIAAGNTLGPLCGAYVLRNYIQFKPPTLRQRDNLGMIGVALLVPSITASAGVLSLLAAGNLTMAQLQDTWVTWWIGDSLGILFVAPFIFKWFVSPFFKRTGLEYLELCGALLAVTGTSFIIFWTPETYFAYYIFIPLAWVALRTGPRGMTLALLLVATISIAGTILGHGPFGEQSLFYLQTFLGMMSALFLVFTAVVEERKNTLLGAERHVQELEQALQRISSEDEAKKDFIAVLAHELRNPLATMLSSVELLKLHKSSELEASVHLQNIDDRVRSMGRILDDLLDISRISRNKLTLEKETISLDRIIDQAVRSAQALIRSRGHTLSVIKPEEEIFLEADPIRFEQIIVNLLTNAAKYTNPKGHIRLASKREADELVIRVRDNGIGIPKNMLVRIFEPFFQVERGRAGLGVGLPLIRQLVEMHGGTIEAISAGEGRGSEFIIRVPLPAQTKAPVAAKSPSLKGRALRRVKHALNILVVDDNEEAADALARLLQLRGHTVETAYNGTNAIEKTKHMLPQIVILDIGLPDMDGYEVARLLRAQKDFSGAIIALTGYGQTQDKEKASEVGFSHHLTKPVGLKEIEAVLRKLSR